VAAPDIPYGPPLAGDSAAVPLTPLNFDPQDRDEYRGWRGRVEEEDEERRPPISKTETEALIRKYAGGGEYALTVMPIEQLGGRLGQEGLSAFVRASFGDAALYRDAAAAAAAADGAPPPLSICTTRVRLRAVAGLSDPGSQVTAEHTDETGCAWRITLSTPSSRPDVLFISIDLIEAPPGTLLTLVDPADGGRLLPANILVVANEIVHLDSHMLFAPEAEDGSGHGWSHFIYWPYLRPRGKASMAKAARGAEGIQDDTILLVVTFQVAQLASVKLA